MSSFQEQLALYQEQHTDSSNKLLHRIGIPAVLCGLFMLLSWINLDLGTVWKISFAWLAALLLIAYYFKQGVYKLAGATAVLMLILLLLASWLAGPYPSAFSFILFLVLLVGGAVALYLGHTFEKNAQTLSKNLHQALLGPLFLVNELFVILGLEKSTNPPSDSPNSSNQTQ